MIAEQRSLIEELAHSNQEYIHKFEKLKLGIEGTPVEHVDDASDIGAVGRATLRMSLLGAPTGKLERMNSAVGGTPLQDKENTRSLGPKDLIAAARSWPKAQSSMVRSLATPPNANTNNVLINTSVHTNTAVPPVQVRGIPTTEAPMEFDQEVLFKQLKHYSMLIKNLLKEVDESQYEITFKSRSRVKGGIAGLHEGEMQELEKMWGCAALQSAEQRFESLEEGFGELSRNNRSASKRTERVFSLGGTGRRESPSMTANLGSDSKKQEEAVIWLPRATSDGRLIHSNSVTGASTMENTFKIPVSVDEAAAKESSMITDVSESNPSEKMAVGAYTGNDPVPESDFYLSDEKYIMTSDSALRASTDNSRNVKLFASMADGNTNAAEKGKKRKGGTSTYDSMLSKMLRRKNVRGLILKSPAIQGCTDVSGDALGGAFSAASNTSDLRDAEGVRQIYGHTKNELTQDKLALPAAKKMRGNKATSPLTSSQIPTTVAQANKLPSFEKTESPHVRRTPVMREHIRSIWRLGTNSAVPDQLASGAEQPLTYTPASLVTPQYSFARSKADGQGSANMMPVMTSATPDQLAPQQQDTAMSGFNGLDGGVDVRASNT